MSKNSNNSNDGVNMFIIGVIFVLILVVVLLMGLSYTPVANNIPVVSWIKNKRDQGKK